MLTCVRGGVFLGVRHAPSQGGRALALPKNFFGTPYLGPYGFTYKTTKFRIVAGRVFRGSAMPHCSAMGPQSPVFPNFSGPYICPCGMGYGTDQPNFGWW